MIGLRPNSEIFGEFKMVESIVQVYQDVGGKTLFAQVMKVDLLEDRRKESQELEFNLD